jgi:transketolase
VTTPSADLVDLCRQVRLDVLEMVREAGSGHIDSSFSCVEILVALYFGRGQLLTPNQRRDRVVLSKGHASPALYATLARRGYFPTSELSSFRKYGSRLQGHPRLTTPGVDAPTGSVGQGLSIGCGLAYAGLDVATNLRRVFVIIGDADLDEGQTWEALLFAGHRQLKNLTVIYDSNSLQYSGSTAEILTIPAREEVLPHLGWEVKTINGHDLGELQSVLESERRAPLFIEAQTIKGKGFAKFENVPGLHGKVPPAAEIEEAMRALS